MAEEETPQERSKRMIDEARREFLKHEELHKANKGRNPMPLLPKLKIALPLALIAYGIYTYTIVQFRKQLKEYGDNDRTIITDPRDIDVPEEEYEVPDMTLRDFYNLVEKPPKPDDDAEVLTDTDFKWKQRRF